MSFSDEDLRILKAMCKSCDWPVSGKQLGPLLARLEAAEHIVKIVEKNGDGSLWNECEAWRKAAGR